MAPQQRAATPTLDDALVALSGLARSLEQESDTRPENELEETHAVRIERMRLESDAMRALLAVQQEGARHVNAA